MLAGCRPGRASGGGGPGARISASPDLCAPLRSGSRPYRTGRSRPCLERAQAAVSSSRRSRGAACDPGSVVSCPAAGHAASCSACRGAVARGASQAGGRGAGATAGGHGVNDRPSPRRRCCGLCATVLVTPDRRAVVPASSPTCGIAPDRLESTATDRQIDGSSMRFAWAPASSAARRGTPLTLERRRLTPRPPSPRFCRPGRAARQPAGRRHRPTQWQATLRSRTHTGRDRVRCSHVAPRPAPAALYARSRPVRLVWSARP